MKPLEFMGKTKSVYLDRTGIAQNIFLIFSSDGSLVWSLFQGNLVKAINLLSKEQKTLPISEPDAHIFESYTSEDLSKFFAISYSGEMIKNLEDLFSLELEKKEGNERLRRIINENLVNFSILDIKNFKLESHEVTANIISGCISMADDS